MYTQKLILAKFWNQFELRLVYNYTSSTRKKHIHCVLIRLLRGDFSYTYTYTARSSLPGHESIVINRFEGMPVDIFILAVVSSVELDFFALELAGIRTGAEEDLTSGISEDSEPNRILPGILEVAIVRT